MEFVLRVSLRIMLIILYKTCTNAAHHYANITGDVMLGALFPIHIRSHVDCGQLQDQDGIQLLEAMLYGLDLVNNDSNLLPGFKIGALAMDTCNSDTRALEHALEFVKLKVRTIQLEQVEQSWVCSDGKPPHKNEKSLPDIIGVVGASASEVSIQVASFLRLFKVPQISYMSTSIELSDKKRYGYFQRTVPSDIYQARAIVEILKTMQWHYVSAVYEDSSYGINGFTEIKKLAEEVGICFGTEQKLQKFNVEGSIPPEETDSVLDAIVENTNTEGQIVVVLFVHHYNAFELFRATKKRDITNIIWVGCDGWSGRHIENNLTSVIDGAITVQPLARKLEGFDQYFQSLNPENNERNPWFKEFWENHFHCKFDPMGKQSLCTGKEKLTEETGYSQQLNLYFVVDAVLVYAHALKTMQRDKCGSAYRGLCPSMNISGEELLDYLHNVHFNESLGLEFSFLNATDGPPNYSIMTFRNVQNKFQWQEIGNYSDYSSEIDKLVFYEPVARRYKTSICSPPCPGESAIRSTGKCCFECSNCSFYQYLPSRYQCVDCPEGSLPNAMRNACSHVPVQYLKYSDPWAISVCVISIVGISLSLVIGALYYVYRNTPILKASGTEISFILSIGIICSYAATFIFVAKPSAAVCGSTRFFLGLCYTVCYASILTKTNRIYRIFKLTGTMVKKKRFTSSKSTIIITLLIVGVESIVLIVWLVFDPPRTAKIFPSKTEVYVVCEDSTNFSYLGALIFPFILMIICIVFAILTRKTPDGFNETRYIAFCSYCTLVMWLAFVPIYFFVENNTIQVVTLCLSLSFNSSVILICLFVTKIYIVIYRPEKNTRENVMARWTSHSGEITLDEFSNAAFNGQKTGSTFSIDKSNLESRRSSYTKSVEMSVIQESIENTGHINENVLQAPKAQGSSLQHNSSNTNPMTNDESSDVDNTIFGTNSNNLVNNQDTFDQKKMQSIKLNTIDMNKCSDVSEQTQDENKYHTDTNDIVCNVDAKDIDDQNHNAVNTDCDKITETELTNNLSDKQVFANINDNGSDGVSASDLSQE